jgi:arabinofuranosyltransferase
VLAALAACVIALLGHAWIYRFLTDDSYISFRYSLNFAHGRGLVWNAGYEAVEGYSNFLWVLILALFERIGIHPEQAATPLSLLATGALSLVVARFAWRRAGDASRWPVVIAPALLALTRSVAVWSTSGLETRLFELLAVAGALQLVEEVEAYAAGGAPRRAWAPWLFALATLTRPDGLLISGAAAGAAGAYLWGFRRDAVGRLVRAWLPYAALIAAHFAFRRLYYGYWLPNTYYAKVGGQTWWSSGGLYLQAFMLEYAAYLWAPFLTAGIVYHLRRHTGFVPLLFAAIVLPHALYVAAIGGDHFEYRPIDLYFPFAYLLIADGARFWSRGVRSTWAVAAGLAIVAFGVWQLPWRSHAEFPRFYASGFPGERGGDALAFLDPARDPVYRLPLLRNIAAQHQADVRALTSTFVGVRAEEHRLFLSTVMPEGHRLRQLVEQGVLPKDVYIAMSCVGAIPYYSGIRTLDRLGLTDATVAHSKAGAHRMMAHDKAASPEYVRARGVDLWVLDPVHTLEPVTSSRLLLAVKDAEIGADTAWAAPVSDSEYVLCRLPLGIERERARLPKLHLVPCGDSAFVRTYLARADSALRATLDRHPNDIESGRKLAYVLLVAKRYDDALPIYLSLVRVLPDNPAVWENLGVCYTGLGRWDDATQAVEKSIAISRDLGWTSEVERLSAKRDDIQRARAESARPSAARRATH